MRWRRFLAIPVVAVSAVVLVAGLVAANQAAPTGYKTVTHLTVTPAVATVLPLIVFFPSLNATLTNGTHPLPTPGAKITFTAGSTFICSGITDAQGVATCSGSASLLSIVLNLGYTASYAGSADLAPSSANAPLITL